MLIKMSVKNDEDKESTKQLEESGSPSVTNSFNGSPMICPKSALPSKNLQNNGKAVGGDFSRKFKDQVFMP